MFFIRESMSSEEAVGLSWDASSTASCLIVARI
jgi:hypothetical protein